MPALLCAELGVLRVHSSCWMPARQAGAGWSSAMWTPHLRHTLWSECQMDLASVLCCVVAAVAVKQQQAQELCAASTYMRPAVATLCLLCVLVVTE